MTLPSASKNFQQAYGFCAWHQELFHERVSLLFQGISSDLFLFFLVASIPLRIGCGRKF